MGRTGWQTATSSMFRSELCRWSPCSTLVQLASMLPRHRPGASSASAVDCYPDAMLTQGMHLQAGMESCLQA